LDNLVKQILSHPSQASAILQSARKYQKISQTDMAELLDASQPAISRYEMNPENIKLGDFLQMCQKLGLEITISEKPNLTDKKTQAEW
jgi:transcriptional regulator with XRE-family HTH domain